MAQASQKSRWLAFIDHVSQKGAGAVQAQALGIGQFTLDQRFVIVAPEGNVMGGTAGCIVKATQVAVGFEIVHGETLFEKKRVEIIAAPEQRLHFDTRLHKSFDIELA